ncbi:MAG: precorrin-3B C(17)-methyltransferase [Oscillatoriaceae bacterium SKW80]|nr:precorrin-3B C(17)-methyltransferase [Oscillatoriaceae bacterium SKYG93]MCX8120512.1 precorrin-3B C(17)-methyltransferase [Oscillatoriaceae bacterium SKW80]MDW8452750.1 precorrin-3B C(17)-methyltransferase [Oscillatoriaceae cyanobacterium SKYGB_i_bin93]HIK27180.1 precorrin-3B C(17)-methyltransferase [Oscillatoriaceae cyanobacterium M7585_C2015_266]
MELILEEFQPIAAIATTIEGAKRLQFICQTGKATLWVPESLKIENSKIYKGSLKNHIAEIWQHYKSFIFSLAAGAVVRIIAPLLQNKSKDPAVVIIDETGKFAISICSGHQGGAEKLTRIIARKMGATPVLTGASAALNLPGIDILGIPFGWQRGRGDWKGVSAAVARGELVQVIQEDGSTLWQYHLPEKHPFYFQGIETSPPAAARIWISCKERFIKEYRIPEIQWHPRVLWVGVGCERGTSKKLIETAIEKVCRENQLAEKAIAGIATIDIKANEAGLVELCSERAWPLRTFSPDILRALKVPNPSTIVEAEVGTPSVAEAAAIAAATSHSQCPNPPIPTSNPLIVPKQIYRSEKQTGAATVAIARSEIEYTARSGKLLLVGTGPGDLEQMTPAAQSAIAAADAVIGYTLYIDLIAPLLRPGQIVESLPIKQERQRAQRAIALANWGLSVAVVSSGDAGIYGMAGLILEELKAQGWDGKTPAVQVFPGITAMQAAASRVGAPLMHDFCAISLSDLLTPWEVIEKRLTAAAMADFVTALYNPRSRNRTEQLVLAREIFLKYRHPDTPVAIVRSAYRKNEQIFLTTLEKFLEIPIDMFTTVLIGNHSTRTYAEWMITPRGYMGFDSANK